MWKFGGISLFSEVEDKILPGQDIVMMQDSMVFYASVVSACLEQSHVLVGISASSVSDKSIFLMKALGESFDSG